MIRFQGCIMINVFTLSTCYSYQILMRFQSLRQNLEKWSNIKFHKYPSIGSRVFLYGVEERRTDRHINTHTHTHTHDKANSRYSQFYEST